MYITAIEQNAVVMQSDIYPNAENFQFNVFTSIISNASHMIWPDTLAFDNKEKKLYVLANQFQNFNQSLINFSNPVNGDANFYIWSIYINDKSYLEDCLGSNTSADDTGFPHWAIALVIIVVAVVIVIAVCAIRNYIQARKRRKTFL